MVEEEDGRVDRRMRIYVCVYIDRRGEQLGGEGSGLCMYWLIRETYESTIGKYQIKQSQSSVTDQSNSEQQSFVYL